MPCKLVFMNGTQEQPMQSWMSYNARPNNNRMGAIKQTNVTPEYLRAKGARLVGPSRKFDGACVLPSTLWAMPSGICYHLITYSTPETHPHAAIHSRLFSSVKRVAR